MLAIIYGFLWYIFAVTAGLLVVFCHTEFKRRTGTTRVHIREFPEEWLEYMEANLPMYKKMPMDLRAEYQDKVWRFIEQKQFIPCGDLDYVSDEMKVTTAGNACLMLLNKDMQYCFPKIYTILMYSTSHFLRSQDEEDLMNGETWPNGSVVIAWDAARKNSRSLRDTKHTILHTITHKLDVQAGCDEAGCPAIDGFQHRIWAGAIQNDFEAFKLRLSKGQPTAIDGFGKEDAAEYFAVATETFFERPDRLHRDHPAVYEQLRLFYRVDPLCWNAEGVGVSKDDI